VCEKKKSLNSSWPIKTTAKFYEFKNFLKEISNNKPFSKTYYITLKKLLFIFSLKEFFIYFKHQLNADDLRNQ